ncbi:hypothetical protein OROGR_001584 [Orobanche gracilis]
MLPPELQPRAFRPYISSSVSTPSFPTTSYNGDQNLNPSPSTSSSYGATASINRRASSSMTNSRLSHFSFVHNARIAVALVPSAAFLLDLGGAPVVAILTVGLMVAYIFDSINFKSGSFFAVWFSLIAAQITFFFSSSFHYTFNYVSLTLVAALTCAFANFLIGVWVSLQFKWMQIEYPTIVVALERLLFACVPNIASALFTWATVSAVVGYHGAIVIGFPVLFLPIPSVAGYYLARFFTKKSLSSYSAFVVLGSLMLAWFVMHNYWDLNIWISGMSLKSFCKLLVGTIILAMAVPGLAVFPPQFRFLTEAGLISHALLLCYVENNFFNYSNVYFYGMDDDVMYPSYMVFMTTLVGLAIVRRLSVDHRVGSKAVWVLICLYSSKLSMLFMASKAVLWVSAVLLLAVSPPLLLYKDKSKSASKMKPWQGYMHAAVVALSVLFCRETIFEALQWWNGRSPSDGLLLGSCILLAGLACVPIVALHFSHVMVQDHRFAHVYRQREKVGTAVEVPGLVTGMIVD